MAAQHYATSSFLLTTTDNTAVETLTVPALLFYTGTHTSMEGNERTYRREDLDAIVTATNAYLGAGRRIKIYASDFDHGKISQGTTIGVLTGEIRLEDITRDRLPLPGLDELIGEWGIFGTVQIAGADNVQQYRDGRLKELSIGLTADNVIVEVSAVALPVLAGAALFGVRPLRQQPRRQFALTMTEQIQEDGAARVEDQIWQLCNTFMNVLVSIRIATPEQLGNRTPEQLRSHAVTDLTEQQRARLQLPAVLPTLPLFSLPVSPMMTQPDSTPEPAFSAEQLQQLQQDNQALRDRLDQMQREQTASSRFSQLKERAIALRSAGKLTPAQFKELFEPSPDTIARFAKADNRDLDQLQFFLDQIDKYATPIQFGMPTTPPLIPDQLTEEQTEAEARRLMNVAERYGQL